MCNSEKCLEKKKNTQQTSTGFGKAQNHVKQYMSGVGISKKIAKQRREKK